MTVEQIEANGDGYFQPVRGFMNSISYDFTVTVNPCDVKSVQKTPASSVSLNHKLGDPQFSEAYSFVQSTDCNYETTTTIVEGLPDFIFHDELSNELLFDQTFDASLIATYTITVRNTLVQPTSASDPSETETIITDV